MGRFSENKLWRGAMDDSNHEKYTKYKLIPSSPCSSFWSFFLADAMPSLTSFQPRSHRTAQLKHCQPVARAARSTSIGISIGSRDGLPSTSTAPLFPSIRRLIRYDDEWLSSPPIHTHQSQPQPALTW